jgi:hypothetical protein
MPAPRKNLFQVSNRKYSPDYLVEDIPLEETSPTVVDDIPPKETSPTVIAFLPSTSMYSVTFNSGRSFTALICGNRYTFNFCVPIYITENSPLFDYVKNNSSFSLVKC